MKSKTKRKWDAELEEFIEEKELNPTGFCQLCGGINTSPQKVGLIWICSDCRSSRLEDAMKMSEDFREKVRHL